MCKPIDSSTSCLALPRWKTVLREMKNARSLFWRGKSEINDELLFYSAVRRTRQTSGDLTVEPSMCVCSPLFVATKKFVYGIITSRALRRWCDIRSLPQALCRSLRPSSQFIRQSNLFEYFIWFSSCCPFQMISSDGRLSFNKAMSGKLDLNPGLLHYT